MQESESTDLKVTRIHQDRRRRPKEKHSQQTGSTNNRTMKEGRVCPRQHLLPCSLGKQECARLVLVTLNLQKSHAQFPWALKRNNPHVTVREPAKAILPILRMSRMTDLPTPLSASTHTGTRTCTGCRCLAGHGICFRRAERQQCHVSRAPRTRRWGRWINHGDILHGGATLG
jgi:hypothetical protein